MAGTNKLIQFGTWELGSENTYTDDELVALTAGEKQGIVLGSTAYSNILNALLRQSSLAIKSIGDVIADKANVDVNTSITSTVFASRFNTAIENIAKGVTVTKDTITFTGKKSGVTVNSQGLVTNVEALVSTDLPALAISKITGLQTALDGKVPNTRKISNLDLSADRSRDDLIGMTTVGIVKRTAANTYSAYTLVATDIPALAISKITDLQTTLDAKVPSTRTIAGLALSANRSRDDIIGITSNGLVKRTGANTYDVDTTAYTPTTRTIAGLSLASNRSRDDIIGVSANGFVKRTGVNTYAIDNKTYAEDANVVKKLSGFVGDIVMWRGTQAAYDLLTIDPGDTTIYVVTP